MIRDQILSANFWALLATMLFSGVMWLVADKTVDDCKIRAEDAESLQDQTRIYRFGIVVSIVGIISMVVCILSLLDFAQLVINPDRYIDRILDNQTKVQNDN